MKVVKSTGGSIGGSTILSSSLEFPPQDAQEQTINDIIKMNTFFLKDKFITNLILLILIEFD
ncbi:MAG: hypothetical protein CO117_05095 [Flavobacteriaceae bacterium CG_4_9_14_3_um_filter_33_16]|nr:MAG: hypothetical protein CO117_05095 [Flavobacteriaceae bacterium CG_4_9_14_3_um_filter_33_16]